MAPETVTRNKIVNNKYVWQIRKPFHERAIPAFVLNVLYIMDAIHNPLL